MTTSNVFCLENNFGYIILVCESIQTISQNFAIANNFYIPCSFSSRPSEFELKTVLPIVINTFKSKYAVQSLIGFY